MGHPDVGVFLNVGQKLVTPYLLKQPPVGAVIISSSQTRMKSAESAVWELQYQMKM